MTAAVQITHRLPRREPTGDARIGNPEPDLSRFVRVLCRYRYTIGRDPYDAWLLISVRSSRAIPRAFDEAMQAELEGWSPHLGPKPRAWDFYWYLPENGREVF